LRSGIPTSWASRRLKNILTLNLLETAHERILEGIHQKIGSLRIHFTPLVSKFETKEPSFSYADDKGRWSVFNDADSTQAMGKMQFNYDSLMISQEQSDLTPNKLINIEIRLKDKGGKFIDATIILATSSDLQIKRIGSEGISIALAPAIIDQIRRTAKAENETLDSIQLSLRFLSELGAISVAPSKFEQNYLLNRKFNIFLASCMESLGG
jgi:hypothetical protein